MIQSIFARPVFINPQAYLVIPELVLINRSIPFNLSSNQYVFQVITTGQIEGKLLQTEDKTILHLDLHTVDGDVVLGEFYLENNGINPNSFILEQTRGFVTLKFEDDSSKYLITADTLFYAEKILKNTK